MEKSMTNVLDGYLTEHALAAQLKRDVRTLQRWRRLRTGPPVTFIGRVPYYRITYVHEWLAAREVKMVRERKRAA
jgi:hypothetical protein